MLSFVHTADLHFGRSKHSNIDSSTGLHTSLVNDMQAFNEVIDIAEKEDVDLVVLAGDVFDKIHVSNSVRKEVAKCFRRILSQRDLVVIVGTHDRAHDKYAAHTLSDWMSLAGGDSDHMSRLHIFEKPDSMLYSKNGKVLGQIIVLPEPTKGLLEGKTYLEYIKDYFDSADLQKDIPVLVIGHFSVSGAKAGDEGIDVSSYRPTESLPVEFFDERDYIDYVALGHIHYTQELGRTGKVVYPGSLNYCSFTELNLKKGVYVCRISDSKRLEKKFVEIKSPIALKQIKIDVRNEKDPMSKIRREISENSLSSSIVKLVVAADEDQHKRIDEAEVKGLLSPAVSSTVAFDIVRPFKVRDASITLEVSEKEAYDRYLEAMNFSDEIKAEMKKEFEIVTKLFDERLAQDIIR